MKAPNLHLNLLREQEVVSSSPVRIRVLLPVLAALACVAVLGWWGMLFAQETMVKSQIRAIEDDLAARKAQHAEVQRNMVAARDLQAELDQLAMYANGRRTYGDALARLAEGVADVADFTLCGGSGSVALASTEAAVPGTLTLTEVTT